MFHLPAGAFLCTNPYGVIAYRGPAPEQVVLLQPDLAALGRNSPGFLKELPLEMTCLLGLREGDTLVSVNGQEIQEGADIEDFKPALEESAGKPIETVVMRYNKRKGPAHETAFRVPR